MLIRVHCCHCCLFGLFVNTVLISSMHLTLIAATLHFLIQIFSCSSLFNHLYVLVIMISIGLKLFLWFYTWMFCALSQISQMQLFKLWIRKYVVWYFYRVSTLVVYFLHLHVMYTRNTCFYVLYKKYS